jgi:hypothetical protein
VRAPIAEHLIATAGLIEAEYLVGTAQRVPQRGGLGGNDLQWLAVGTGGVQPEIQSALAFGQPLARGSPERFDLALIMG